MGIAYVRDRVGKLERSFAPKEPDLTRIEIEYVTMTPVADREPPANLARRIERRGHIVHGANIISARNGNIIVKRIIGVDPSEI